MDENSMLSAKETRELFNMSEPTFYRHLKFGPPKKRNGGQGIDIRQIPFVYIGGRRFFSKKAALELIQGSN